MHKTIWRNISRERRIRAEFGIRKHSDTEPGYFSVTGEIQQIRGGRWNEETAGCIHADISLFFPELAPFVKWHLTDDTGTPMHYIANGRYWLQVANHVIFANDLPAVAIGHFKKTVLFGEVEGDSSFDLNTRKTYEIDAWLEARLPALQAKFKADMAKIEELASSSWFLATWA